jgi:hypothetical protein
MIVVTVDNGEFASRRRPACGRASSKSLELAGDVRLETLDSRDGVFGAVNAYGDGPIAFFTGLLNELLLVGVVLRYGRRVWRSWL